MKKYNSKKAKAYFLMKKWQNKFLWASILIEQRIGPPGNFIEIALKVFVYLLSVSHFSTTFLVSHWNQITFLIKFSFSEKVTKIGTISSWFWHLLCKRQNHKADSTNFCGLLRKAELYNRDSRRSKKLGFIMHNEFCICSIFYIVGRGGLILHLIDLTGLNSL